MISNAPILLVLLFILTAILSLILFRRAIVNSSAHAGSANRVTALLVLLLIFEAALAYSGFFLADTESLPPRIALIGGPFLMLTILAFVTKKGRAFVDDLDMRALTWLSIVRIPVEFGLWWLFLIGAIPEIMTFEGQNFDILLGITAPVMVYLVYQSKQLGRKALLAWNVIGLILLCNIVFTAILSVPSPIQQLSFHQPNIAILHFPFVWLASFIAPVVMFSHFVGIRRLMIVEKELGKEKANLAAS